MRKKRNREKRKCKSRCLKIGFLVRIHVMFAERQLGLEYLRMVKCTQVQQFYLDKPLSDNKFSVLGLALVLRERRAYACVGILRLSV